MTAHVRDIVIEQGATFYLAAKISLNLTGWIGRGQVRATTRDSQILAAFAVVITDPVGGKFEMKLTPDQTKAMKAPTGVYDIELVSPDGLVLRVLAGQMTLSLEVTR